MPFRSPSEACLNASFISSTPTSFSSTPTKSTIEPVGTGTLIAMPSSLPASSGITTPVAVVAPDVVGMMLRAAALALLRSLCALSRILWSLV